MSELFNYTATVLRVIDGDTYVLRVDLGFRVSVDIEARLNGVDTPELSTEAGRAIKDTVTELLAPPCVVHVRSYKDRRSFARWVVDVTLADGMRLTDWILARQLGEPMVRLKE